MSRLAKLFELNRKGLNLPRGFIVAGVLLVLTALLIGLGHVGYVLTFIFAVLFAALSDPGGKFGYRVQRMALFGVLGALLTALGFGIGESAWGWVVLATFVVTLSGGLAVRFGLHRFESGELLTYWFLIAISLPLAYKADRIKVSTWKETVAWLIATALWIAVTGALWLARGRKERPQWIPEFPASTAAVKLTGPVVAFAVIRALAPTVAVAIAFGLHLPHADWMPVAALVAMKSNLQQSALVAGQRLTGAILGAAVAALFLLTVHNKYALGVVIVLLVAAGVSVRTVNYALYCTAIAGSVLISIDIANPTNFASEGRRVLFTLAGVGIGLAFTLLTYLLQKRGAKASPKATRQAA
ncbi:MAG TPA: FUSC family protein [Thermoleophilia bacterium]|nr:FUSC family protein [Thermoleophilia bacterium]